MQNLSPIGWALRPLKRYAEFSGRSSRAEFWWFMLFMMIAYLVVWFGMLMTVGFTAGNAASTSPNPLAMLGAFGAVGILMVLFWLVLLVPTIALTVRRLHDSDRSGWWLGAFYLLYAVYFALMFGSLGMAMRSAAAGNGAPPSPPSMGMLGATMVIGLVIFVYAVVLLVFYCLPGTRGANRFGDDPYGANVGEVFA